MDNNNAFIWQDLKGSDPKARIVNLSVIDKKKFIEGKTEPEIETYINVSKQGCPHFDKSFDDYDDARKYFDFMCICSQN